MKKVLWLIVCLMTMVVSANAHNTHYPTYTEDGITYVATYVDKSGNFTVWDIVKVDKPYDKTIVIPSTVIINGKDVKIGNMGDSIFSTCVSLDSLIISDGLMLSKNAFRGCRELKYLYYSNGSIRDEKSYPMTYNDLRCKTLETSVGVLEESFWKTISGSLEKLIIKEDSRWISTKMDLCGNLKTIVCYAANPPQSHGTKSPYVYSCWGEVSFETWQWSTITLYVPRESLKNYYFDNVWGEIDNIYPIDEMNNDVSTFISSIPNNTNENGVWYSLNGTKVDKPTKGIYIKNGKKYIIK